jgi:hypothetical protein
VALADLSIPYCHSEMPGQSHARGWRLNVMPSASSACARDDDDTV